MNPIPRNILIIGYGNPGRLDDGLGPLFAEAMSAKGLPGVSVDANYLLTVEDAADISGYDVVIFADAAVTGAEPFYFRPVRPKAAFSFSSHHVEPAAVLGLAHDMFDSCAAGYVLGIRGYEFDEFGQRISARAHGNLLDAVAFMTARIERGDFSVFPGEEDESEPAAKGDERCRNQTPRSC